MPSGAQEGESIDAAVRLACCPTGGVLRAVKKFPKDAAGEFEAVGEFGATRMAQCDSFVALYALIRAASFGRCHHRGIPAQPCGGLPSSCDYPRSGTSPSPPPFTSPLPPPSHPFNPPTTPPA